MAKASVSKIKDFVSLSCGNQVWVGVDVHKTTYHVAVLRGDGLVKDWSATASPQLLVKQLRSWEVEIGSVAYEAGPTGFGLARALEEAGIKAIVAPPSRIPRPVSKGAKTDRLDCIALAIYASKGMLKSIALPSRDQEAKRSLGRRRDQISREVRRTRQRIKSFLLVNGIAEPAGLRGWSNKGIEGLRTLELPEGHRYTLDSLLLDLDHHLVSRQIVDEQLKQLIDHHEDDRKAVDCMQTVPGVGIVTATKFRLEIFDPQRFRHPKEVACLVGLAPMDRRTGHQKGQAKLKPSGQKELRSLLVEAAWRLRAQEKWAREFYNRVLAANRIPQKAIVALARKLCIILWRICVETRPYRTSAV